MKVRIPSIVIHVAAVMRAMVAWRTRKGKLGPGVASQTQPCSST